MVLEMGRTPLANALLTVEQLGEPEATYPLDTVFCPDCTLVQITETVPPEVLFSEYLYFSSFSDTMLRHAQTIADRLVDERHLGANSLVAEVASNDGYLLQYYQKRGVPVLGIEPAKNIAAAAEKERGIATVCDFFGKAVARRLADEGKRADVIHANNVLAHVADLNGVVAGFAAMLKPDGIAVIEAPYVRDMIDHVEFDTIYHEHLCYFSLSALDRLFARHGLRITHVERLPIHGGSLRIYAQHAARHEADASVTQLLAEEAKLGMTRFDYYSRFADRVRSLREELRKVLLDFKKQSKHLAVYGASAKGSTLLNYFDLGADVLDFVADRSTVKQGRYTPGTHLPILSPQALLDRQPDAVLLLTWNFKDEILAQQAEYRSRGGKFIVPIPHVHIV